MKRRLKNGKIFKCTNLKVSSAAQKKALLHLNHSFTYAWVATKGPSDFWTNDSVPVTEEMKAESLFTKQFNSKIGRSSWLSTNVLALRLLLVQIS